MRRNKFAAAVTVFAMLFALGPGAGTAFAQDGAGKLDQKRVDAAVKKGVEFLKGRQNDDGSWTGAKRWEKEYPFGTTALALLAIVKGGEPKDSPHIKKALNYMRTFKTFPHVYDASCLILALAALVESEPEKKPEKQAAPPEKGFRTTPAETEEKKLRKRFKKMPPWLHEWIRRAVNYLAKVRGEYVWRYPATNLGGNQDASNTQYVMMALFAARRLGINAPKNIYPRVAEYFIVNQEDKGPEVKPFYVPGVDLSLKDLKDLEKRWNKELNKKLKAEQKRAKAAGGKSKGVDPTTMPREDPYTNFGGELPKFYARGWAYLPKDAPKSFGTTQTPQFMMDVTGSMTASGIIACMLCKAELERTGWYRKYGKKLEKAIRDGLAWLVHNWTTSKNPGASAEDSWRYYYFYALERAGVLSLVHKIGGHDWYNEVGGIILSGQSADGSWPGASAVAPQGILPFEHGPIWNTCFAILFLKKATTPIVTPKVIWTGQGVLGGGGKK